jgi:N-acetylglucosaminyldiphosphoundecaprenol N-acetyl-beta-D-mannosaminyltransferase
MPLERPKPRLHNIPRLNVLGVGISCIDLDTAVTLAEEAIENGPRGYVCVTGVHGVMEAQADPEFKKIQNLSLFTTPDGVPLVWLGRFRNYAIRRVYGPDFMLAMCRISERRGYTHFFYGGKIGVADSLKCSLQKKFPDLQVVGTYTPPFRPLTSKEETELFEIVGAAKPDFFWVGLSTPKQERFMAEYINRLPAKVMVGVGAAFDLHTGGIKDSPAWIKNAGLQWFHRLLQEPRRLWRRYLINNPRFVYRAILQQLGFQSFPMIGAAERSFLSPAGLSIREMTEGND